MKVKIYVNTDEYGPSEQFPRVLTEKQYQDKIKTLVKDRLDDLKNDDSFIDMLTRDYNIGEIFFMSEERKQQILEEFKPYIVDSVKDEMETYYEEYEIEI